MLGLIRAIRLPGSEGILTRIHPNIAQTIVALEVDLAGIVVHRDLRGALRHCIARMRQRSREAGANERSGGRRRLPRNLSAMPRRRRPMAT